MTAAAVAVNDNGRRAGEGLGRIRPAVAVNHRRDARHLVEAGLEQQTTRAMFMFARTMTRVPAMRTILLSAAKASETKSDATAKSAGMVSAYKNSPVLTLLSVCKW